MKHPKTVLVGPPEPGVDPHLLLLDGRDVRSVNRAERRRHGFRGPVFTAPAPTLVRFVRRHYGAVSKKLDQGRPLTRRERKVAYRTRRWALRRGLA